MRRHLRWLRRGLEAHPGTPALAALALALLFFAALGPPWYVYIAPAGYVLLYLVTAWDSGRRFETEFPGSVERTREMLLSIFLGE
jgi:hypothetical protein